MECNNYNNCYVEDGGEKYIILDLKPHSRVVSFKIEENTISQFDKYIRLLGFRSRSLAIKKLIYAFLEAVEKYLGQNKDSSSKIDADVKLLLSINSLVPGMIIKEDKNCKK